LGVTGEQDRGGEPQADLLVEVHHKHLVVRIARFDKCQRRDDNTRPLVPHAAAVVHHQAHGYGDIFRLEQRDPLKAPGFKHLKVVSSQTGHEVSGSVGDRHGQHD
jgi:hypothetical protein